MTMSKTPKKTFKETKLGKELKKLRDEMKPMSWKQRIDHIWTYYKEYILVFAVFATVIVGLIASSISNLKKPELTGIFVNLMVDPAGMEYVSEDYAEHLGLKDKDLVKIESTYFEDPLVVATDENYYATMILENEVSAQMLDYMILDKMSMEYYARREVYMDLRQFFTKEELQAFVEQDLLVYCLDSEMADQVGKLNEEELKELQLLCLEEDAKIDYYWPGAIKITDMPFIKAYVTKNNDIYFAVAGNTAKVEKVRDMWNYLNAYKAK